MDGKGIFIWENKDKYKGDYKNNMRDGNGVYSFGCNLYDGGWVSEMMHGEGTLLYEGLRIVGKFRYGKILEIIEGKGVNKELTEKYTMDSKTNFKFEDTFKDTIDSRIISGKDSRLKKDSLLNMSRGSLIRKTLEYKSSINKKNSGNKGSINRKTISSKSNTKKKIDGKFSFDKENKSKDKKKFCKNKSTHKDKKKKNSKNFN